jgi:hypothetical protein
LGWLADVVGLRVLVGGSPSGFGSVGNKVKGVAQIGIGRKKDSSLLCRAGNGRQVGGHNRERT